MEFLQKRKKIPIQDLKLDYFKLHPLKTKLDDSYIR